MKPAGIVLAFLCILPAAGSAADPPAKPAGLADLPASWTFSRDAGTTYPQVSLPPVPSQGKPPVWARGRFTVADPSAVGALYLSVAAPPGRQGALSPADSRDVGLRYIPRVPVLLHARVRVNGKPVPTEADDTMLYARYTIDAALLVKGVNVVTVTGLFWNSWSNMERPDSVAVGFRLQQAPAGALELRSGPALGPVGDDYFTFTCRTHIPAGIRVAVEPTSPAGEKRIHEFPRGLLHRLRVPLPKGTRAFRYSVTAVSGDRAGPAQPFDVRVPGASANQRFIVLGQTAAHPGSVGGLVVANKALLEADPDFIIHTGSIVKMAYWDFEWDDSLFGPWHDLLARVPMLVVPAYRDCYSKAFERLFYHATPGGVWRPWTYAAGRVRFLGMDSMAAAANPAATVAWAEGVLREAREDYVFSVSAYPGFIARPFGSGIDGHNFDKERIHPLLVKYQGLALGCTGAYEYVEPPAGRGVRTVITGGVGAEMASGAQHVHHFCLFTVKDGACQMEVVAYETGRIIARQTFGPRRR